MIVRDFSTVPLLGSDSPTALNSANSPLASEMPTTSPTIEASTPMISDSASTERSTWRREAPSVRSVANSRVRCAIVIDSELAITNAPTNSAIPANASSSVFRKPSELSSELVSVCACWRRCGPGRRAGGSA